MAMAMCICVRRWGPGGINEMKDDHVKDLAWGFFGSVQFKKWGGGMEEKEIEKKRESAFTFEGGSSGILMSFKIDSSLLNEEWM